MITKRTLDRDAGSRFKVTAFIDDDPAKDGKTLEGIKIYPANDLEDLLRSNTIAQLILSIQNISPQRKQQIIEKCLSYDVKILNVPPVSGWINGELSFRQIRNIRIEDLLEREAIRLDTEMIQQQIFGKTVLITGGAGSIGSWRRAPAADARRRQRSGSRFVDNSKNLEAGNTAGVFGRLAL